MHLLTAQAGGIEDGSQPVDLAQSPGDVVVLTSADTEIAGLAKAKRDLGDDVPSLRLANLLQLTNNFSIDLYVEQTLSHAKLIVIRVLGGASYWQYGLDEVRRLARGRHIKLAVVSGAAYPDDLLQDYATLPKDDCDGIWTYLVEGGPRNFRNFLNFADHLVTACSPPAAAVPLPTAGLYWPDGDNPDLKALQSVWLENAPVVALTFYRALIQGGDLAPVDAMIEAFRELGLNPLPIFASSLKDPVAAETIASLFDAAPPSAVVNTTAFAASKPGTAWTGTPLDRADCPVLQAILCGANESGWENNPRGLTARDIAMNVALPEIDGRIITRAISFKADKVHDEATETNIVSHRPRPDRVRFVAELVKNWVMLKETRSGARRIAVVLSNYPSTDGQIANGVGLDTAASTLCLLQAMAAAGYPVDALPAEADELVHMLQAGPTNAGIHGRAIREVLPLSIYFEALHALPDELRSEIINRWGAPQDDPFFADDHNGFAIPAVRLGQTLLALQPGRGQGLDPKGAHHDQTIVPPHGYMAFYAWLRHSYGAHAVIHMGKHGNLEWLPGKAMALSPSCYPEAIFGPLPHVYPFIVNDPGEGTQAKRRAGAVIVDHLTPPLTRAESYGPLRDLEALVDEYYEAAGVDPRRIKLLGERILDLARATGIDRDCGIERRDDEIEALTKLDSFLCDLKEMQIRHGLHVFGRSPSGERLTDLLVALVRLPRRDGNGADASLTRALAADLGVDQIDPLDCEMAKPWQGPRPAALSQACEDSWRTAGDTVERLEQLAAQLVSGERTPEHAWQATRAVLTELAEKIRPNVLACGANELAGVLKALNGQFVPPGPSGAPTRGRLDVLPTGRNFYSLDSRTLPTEAAWHLGCASAERVVTAYRQEHGEWPRQFGISAWGTSNMRTGGDDIAQALAFIGVRPTWDSASRRITGFEIISLSDLKRPRIDVVFRISGFFRDAFPTQIDLLDSAFRAVAALNEPANANPLAADARAAAGMSAGSGTIDDEALRHSSRRIFGSAPGAYGAGLKDTIQAGRWHDQAELARAYLQASGYAYGVGAAGQSEHDRFAELIARTDAVIQNQDNREFDLLDSADFFQFEGGMATAAAHTSGRHPTIYHNDHSRPERPVVRTLEQEIARVVRGRAVNPKWIAAARTHGYKGASEMSATLTNLLGFAATTNAVPSHHFELLFEAYLVDPDNLEFLEDANPAALTEMSERFLEAIARGLWQPRRNSAYNYLMMLAEERTTNERQTHDGGGAECAARRENGEAQRAP